MFTINYLEWALSQRNLDVKKSLSFKLLQPTKTSFQNKIQGAHSRSEFVVHLRVVEICHFVEPKKRKKTVSVELAQW